MKPANRHAARRARPRRLIRFAILGATLLALPSGACVDMAARVAINSLFDGITPALTDQLESALAVASEEEVSP